ncbi:MAG: UDP-N-acetylmuramate dehydrogenase [Alphaproteobacteria bacterium]|nr:UDP-N-acetylmuramate dehydrogenase [Alphaproteobacteria bacterium]
MIIQELPKIRGQYRFDYDLSQITWFKTGGKAEVFFKPEDLDDLVYFLKNIDRKIQIHILGNCSNVIVRDGGVKGVVIKLGRNFANISKHNDIIIAGAAALNSSVAQFALMNSYSNFEFLVGIPGCVGGGVKMNAGSYGSEFKDIILSLKAVDFAGNIHIFDFLDNIFSYRKCLLPENLIFIEAHFSARKKQYEEIKSKMDEITIARSRSQPIKEKTGGSTFANPDSYKAWELIDDVGLRGYKIGGAQFSELHCNFLINTGLASSKDLEDLGEMAIQKVKEKRNIQLNWEIKRIGQHV